MNEALKTAVASFVLAAAVSSPGYARACSSGQTGVTPDCPIYTSPATSGSAVGESLMTAGPWPFPLFGGKVPLNGFMVQLNEGPFYVQTYCWVNDNGPADMFKGFFIGDQYNGVPLPNTFVTPAGYHPIGPVSIYCNNNVSIEARAW